MNKIVITILAFLTFQKGFAMDLNRKRPAEEMAHDHTYLNVFNPALILQASRNIRQNANHDVTQKNSAHPLSLRFMMNNMADTGNTHAQPIANATNHNNDRLPPLTDRRFNCAHEGCKNNDGKGFSTKQSLKEHFEYAHEHVIHNCDHVGCKNNDGNGFSTKQNLRRHKKIFHNDNE